MPNWVALSRAGYRRRVLIGVLVVSHLVAMWLYTVYERQSQYLALALDAREQWGNGHIDVAADQYRRFATDYPSVSRPLILVRSFPSRARAWYSLGRVEQQRGNTDAALAAYTEAMHAEAGLGQREYRNLLLEQGRYDDLESSADSRLAASADDIAAWWDLGAAELALGDAQAARRAYEGALAHLPNWLDQHTRAGSGHGLSPEEADLRGLLSVAALLSGDIAAAEASCDNIERRQRPENHYQRLCRAYLLDHAGDHAGARALIEAYQPPAPEHERLAARLRPQASGG